MAFPTFCFLNVVVFTFRTVRLGMLLLLFGLADGSSDGQLRITFLL